MPTIRLGALCWNQYKGWPALLEAGRRADRLDYDTLWTWDHLYPIVGAWDGPILEGWTVLTAWAMATERVRIGLMVGANTFREQSVTAKIATTLDHVSGGRAILGIGTAWFDREHVAYGLRFGDGEHFILKQEREGSYPVVICEDSALGVQRQVSITPTALGSEVLILPHDVKGLPRASRTKSFFISQTQAKRNNSLVLGVSASLVHTSKCCARQKNSPARKGKKSAPGRGARVPRNLMLLTLRVQKADTQHC